MGVSQMPDDPDAVRKVEDLKKAVQLPQEAGQKPDDPKEVKWIENLKKKRRWRRPSRP